MARSRNIKPGFFANEDLAECEPLARLLFAGLWCMADRDGRLEDRPKRIRGEILRYDECDAEPLLKQLHARGFIDRYEHDGVPYIQVIKFGAHQNPHKKEAKSTIPAPTWMLAETGTSGAGPEKAPDEPGAGPVQEQGKHPESPADSLIPDSLIPDSLNTPGPDGCAADMPLPEAPPQSVPAEPAVQAEPAKPKRQKKPAGTQLPTGFEISEGVRAWAELHGHTANLDRHFKYFVGQAIAKAYVYVNWDQALMNAIRDNWAKVGAAPPGQRAGNPAVSGASRHNNFQERNYVGTDLDSIAWAQ